MKFFAINLFQFKIFLLLIAISLSPSSAFAVFPHNGFSDIAKIAMPAYVDVITSKQMEVTELPERGNEGGSIDDFFRDFFGQAPNNQRVGAGSGFIIDASGIIVTNNHVIDGADAVAVILQDGTRLKAIVLGVDDRTDLAVLKVQADQELPFLKWGNSDLSEVGDWSLAIGNPFGLGGTMTLGIISARARDINAGPYVDFIQTDAPINRGNSGGPLLNILGEVIGINTAIFSPTGASVGIGFAIPSNIAVPIVNQLIEFGRARRGWLGVRIQGVDFEIAQGLGLSEPKGALIAGVDMDGPAGKAGIRPGDVVLTFDGKEIAEVRALSRVVAETKIDSVVNVQVWRNRRKQTLRVRVGELTEVAEAALRGAPADDQSLQNSLGLNLTEVTPALKERFGLTLDTEGVLVLGVQASSPAFKLKIQPGDIIIEVSQEKVNSPSQVMRLVEAARDSNRNSVLILLQERDGDLRFVVLNLY